ncbi:MAG: hypothetical protein IKB02_05920 [Clostridia bacterium]|nr:hypothetical protein [Clostridia bacterium]
MEQSNQTKTTCHCTKRLQILEKQIAEMQRLIEKAQKDINTIKKILTQ